MAHTIMTKVGECFGNANAEVGASKKIRKTRACSRHKRHYTCYIVISWWTSSHNLDVLSSSIAKAPSKQVLMLKVFFPGCNHRSSSFLQTQPLSGGGGNWADDWNYWEEEEINENLWWWWLWWYLVLSRTLLTMIMTLQVFSSSASAMDSPYYNPLISMNITYNAMMRPVPAHW